MKLGESIGFGPALFGMHMMAEEKAFRSDSGSFCVIKCKDNRVKAMWAVMRCTSSGCMGPVTRSLCLQDWEMAKVALSCHMALDALCQENARTGKEDVAGSGSERA